MYTLSASASSRYDTLFHYYAIKSSLNWERVKRQAIAESSLNPRAVSPAGAMGLMQFMPATWAEWGEGDPFNPEQSIKAGCAYMNFLFGRFAEIPAWDERYKFALAAYNAGRANINRCLEHAREATGAPRSYAEWQAVGSPRGDWQRWRVASQYLYLVTGRHA